MHLVVVEIQAMIYNAAKLRRLSIIFQVDTCKIKKERIAHVQLSQAMIYNVARVRRFVFPCGYSDVDFLLGYLSAGLLRYRFNCLEFIRYSCGGSFTS